MTYPTCPDRYDGPLSAFLDAHVAPALPKADALLRWNACVMDWARESSGPLMIRRAGRYKLRGRLYDDLEVPFVVSDNEAALWVFMSTIGDAAPEPLDVLVRDQRIPIAYALTAEEASDRWRTVGRMPRERGFADGRWKHCHLLAGAPRGAPPSTADDLRRRAARLLSPLNHFPMPSPRRYEMDRDFGEAPEVLAYVAAWSRERYAQHVALLAAFDDFIAFAAPDFRPRVDAADLRFSFELRAPANVVVLEPSEKVDGSDVYVASDDSIGSVGEGTSLVSLDELVDRLRLWLRTTDEELVGNSPRFGGKAWITFPLGGVRCRLNADTTRAAIAEFVAAHDQSPFSVDVAKSQNGRCNKLHVNGRTLRGFYGYTIEDQAAPRTLHRRV